MQLTDDCKSPQPMLPLLVIAGSIYDGRLLVIPGLGVVPESDTQLLTSANR